MPIAHGPILSLDLLRALKRPIPARAFGANKTWRGALVMGGGTLLAALALDRVPAYQARLPPEVRAAGPVRVGGALGLPAWLGELPNSFVNRRLGIAPRRQPRTPAGAAISLYDQAAWVPVAAPPLRPVWRMSAREIAQVPAIVVAVHLPVNVVGYAIGARSSPI